MNKLRFAGKVALVTGSGRGIGKATLMRLAEDGASGVVVVDLEEQRLAQTVTDLTSLGTDVLSFRCDVTNYSDVRAMIRSTVEKFGRIDILVNNVGASWGATGLSVSEKDWDDIIGVNLKSQFMCIKETVPHMKEQGYGRIVNLSSSAGKYRSQWLAGHPYIAAKAGVIGFTRQLAFELAEHNITANCVVPGNVGTEEGLKDWAEAVRSNPDETEFIMASTPMRRLARPEELAAAITFLASDDASYITGVSLDVNGGLWMA